MKKSLLTFLTLSILAIGCSDSDMNELNRDFNTSKHAVSAYCSVNVQGKGTIAMETDYLPHVIACENGNASYEALKAQAITARSYAYYAIGSGSTIYDSQKSQVYTCSTKPSDRHYQAVLDTQGIVLRYNNYQLCTFFVAGAIPSNKSTCVPKSGDNDWSNTEKYVTYNQGKTGSAVQPSSLGSKSNPVNRGCMSQNVSACLSDLGWNYKDILRYFYGADVVFEQTTGSCITPNSGGGNSGGNVQEGGAGNANACTPETVNNHSSIFYDIEEGNWGLGYAEALKNANITNGCNANPPYFCPKCELPRRQAVTFIYRALGLSEYKPDTASFSDVPATDKNFAEIEAAAKAGVVSGCGNNKFCPDDKITRAEAVTMLTRAIGINTDDYINKEVKHFSDVDAGVWFFPYIQAAVDACIVDGYNDGTFKPKNSINRIEFSKLVAVAFNITPYSNCLKDKYECNSNRDCKNNSTCTDHKCIECTQNACEGSTTIKKCVNGKFETENCEFGCYSGACGECFSDAKDCQGDVPVICRNGRYETSGSACALGCNEGICNECNDNSDCSPSQACSNHSCITVAQCSSNEKKCDGNKLLACNGNEYILEKTCDNGCSNNDCIPTCESGTMKCKDNLLFSCDNGEYVFLKSCTGSCSDSTGCIDSGSSNSGEIGDSCLSASDCATNLVCSNGKCAVQQPSHPDNAGLIGDTCTNNSDCATNLVCTNNICATHTGTGVIGEACSSDADCATNLVCTNGNCARKQNDANEGMIGDTCANDADCATNLICTNHICSKPDSQNPGNVGDSCLSSSDCKSGLICKSEKCTNSSGNNDEDKPGTGNNNPSNKCKVNGDCNDDELCSWPEGICIPQNHSHMYTDSNCSANNMMTGNSSHLAMLFALIPFIGLLRRRRQM